MNTIPRPHYAAIEFADAVRRNWRGWHLSEKADGICTRRELAGRSIWGDAMRDGRLMVWDIDRAFGQDLRRLPWTARAEALDLLFARLSPKLNWHRCASGNGGEFIEAVIQAGGEGVVAKHLDAPWGIGWQKVKRVETFDCIITELNPWTGSIRLALDGEDCGWCPCRREFDRVRLGDVVEIAAYGRHASGKFREARFKRIRHDKKGVA